ncbi:MAG: hypothetical protein WKF91_04710 [Segetibacter sp.]
MFARSVADGIKQAKEMMMKENGNSMAGSVSQKEEAVQQAEEMATKAKPY